MDIHFKDEGEQGNQDDTAAETREGTQQAGGECPR